MYPDLSYLLHDLFGTAVGNASSLVKMFGLMMAAAFFASAFFLYLELKRKAQEGVLASRKIKIIEGEPLTIQELAVNALIGFVLGFKLVYMVRNAGAHQGDAMAFVFSLQGDWIGGIAGALLFAAMKYFEKRKTALPNPVEKMVDIYPHDKVGDITLVAAAGGLLGAKIFAIFESSENIQSFLMDPFGTFFSGSGLAMYGGLVGGFLSVTWYIRKIGIPMRQMMDAVAPALIMGYAVGRIGCQLAGDGDWGIDNPSPAPDWWFLPKWLWSFDYPHNVNNHGMPIDGCIGEYCRHLVPNVYPTPIYETFMALIIFAILWYLRKRLPVTGMLFFVYLFLNGVERLSIELIRVNDKIYAFGISFTQAELIASLCILIGTIGFVALWRERKVVV